jgi:hypothetical protein
MNHEVFTALAETLFAVARADAAHPSDYDLRERIALTLLPFKEAEPLSVAERLRRSFNLQPSPDAPGALLLDDSDPEALVALMQAMNSADEQCHLAYMMALELIGKAAPKQ